MCDTVLRHAAPEPLGRMMVDTGASPWSCGHSSQSPRRGRLKGSIAPEGLCRRTDRFPRACARGYGDSASSLRGMGVPVRGPWGPPAFPQAPRTAGGFPSDDPRIPRQCRGLVGSTTAAGTPVPRANRKLRCRRSLGREPVENGIPFRGSPRRGRWNGSIAPCGALLAVPCFHGLAPEATIKRPCGTKDSLQRALRAARRSSRTRIALNNGLPLHASRHSG